MWIHITLNYKRESLAFAIYKLMKTMFIAKAYWASHNISKWLLHCYQCLLCQSVQECKKISMIRVPSVLYGIAQSIFCCLLRSALACHQLLTVFLDIKIKLTQKIFLNRTQWLNRQSYKYHGSEVYVCLYFSARHC